MKNIIVFVINKRFIKKHSEIDFLISILSHKNKHL